MPGKAWCVVAREFRALPGICISEATVRRCTLDAGLIAELLQTEQAHPQQTRPRFPVPAATPAEQMVMGSDEAWKEPAGIGNQAMSISCLHCAKSCVLTCLPPLHFVKGETKGKNAGEGGHFRSAFCKTAL